jgi:BMFP domain-containing protein YqiC
MDEAIRKLDLVKREDFEAVQEMAANARAGQEAAEARLAALEIRVAALEAGATADDDLPDEDPAAPLIDEL